MQFLPDYAEETCYKILRSLANRMGVEVVYSDSIPELLLAFADVYDLEDKQHKCIVMPINAERIISAGKMDEQKAIYPEYILVLC